MILTFLSAVTPPPPSQQALSFGGRIKLSYQCIYYYLFTHSIHQTVKSCSLRLTTLKKHKQKYIIVNQSIYPPVYFFSLSHLSFSPATPFLSLTHTHTNHIACGQFHVLPWAPGIMGCSSSLVLLCNITRSSICEIYSLCTYLFYLRALKLPLCRYTDLVYFSAEPKKEKKRNLKY